MKRSPTLIMMATALAACLITIAFTLVGARSAVTMPTGAHEGQPSLGQAEAPLRVYLFENYACTHCRAFEERVMPQLERDYIDTGRVELVTINLPNSEEATTAALAGLCAYKQDEPSYWTYRTLIYDAPTSWSTPNDLTDLARTLPNLDAHELRTCIDEARHQRNIERNHELATAAGVTKTPTVVIGEQGFVGTRYAPIRAALERHLAD